MLFLPVSSIGQQGFGIGSSYKVPIGIGYFGTSLEFFNLVGDVGLYAGIHSFPKFSDAYYYRPFPGDELLLSSTYNHKSASYFGITCRFIDNVYFYFGYSKAYIEEWTTYYYWSNDFYYEGIYEVDDYEMKYKHGMDFGIILFFSKWTGLSVGYNTALKCYTFGLHSSFFIH